MNRIFAVILTIVLLTGCALAETAYVAYDGLTYVENGAARQLAGGEILYPQAAENGAYFVSRVEVDAEYGDEYEDTLYFAGNDGSLTQIGQPLRRGSDAIYDEDYTHLAEYTTYNGYTDMTVYGDHIYYIGDDGIGGTYTMHYDHWNDDESGSCDTDYQSGAAVYRMDPDGGNRVCLITGLGNGGAHLAIANDRIAVSSCWRNSLYAYDFSNFMLFDLDGNLLRTIKNDAEDRHSWMYKDEEEFTVIVNRIYTDGETVYASLSNSEGDFASSMLTDMENSDERIALEAYFTDSVFTDQGVVYLASEAESDCWEEEMQYTLHVCLRDDDGERVLAYVPPELGGNEIRLSVSDGYVYISTEAALVRVPLTGGEAEKLENGVFIPAPDCNAENYTPGLVICGAEEESPYLLPDSDTRLYTKDELKDYDRDTLALMRNEILARHGYPFNKEKYKDYFGGQSWYVRNEKFSYNDLNETEMANVETIKALEAK